MTRYERRRHMPRTVGHRFLRLMACLLLVLLLIPWGTVHADRDGYFTRYENYTYDTDGRMIPAPEAYIPERTISAATLGIPSLSGMTEVFVSDEYVYLAAGNAIHILDHDYGYLESIDAYMLDGEEVQIASPGGIFVDHNENLYVTEPGRGRILLFGADRKLIRAMGKPDAVGLEEVTYEPTKLTVDSVGRMFVVSRNVYEGIMELNPNGAFTRYYGVNNVRFNPLELFWRRIATEEQRQRMALWLPTVFSNVTINDDGFIYATVQDSTSREPIKLLNSKGADILRYPEGNRPRGDLKVRGPGSSFIALDTNDYGSYAALDTTRSRIFTYNHDGYLLYVFGGSGNRDGKFQNPVDVKFKGDRILVVDQLAQTLEIFRPTRYGDVINAAVAADDSDDPDAAAALWTEVSRMNPQFDLASISIGDAAYRSGEFETAMARYRRGGFRKGYSDAKEQVRADWLDEHITWILVILFILVLLLTWSLIIKPNLERRKARIEAKRKGVR